MAIRCAICGHEYDATLFQFGRTVRCDCGNVVTLSGGQTIRKDESATRLVLVRHGETDWNAESRLQGHRPVPLNAHGRNEAKLLARRVAAERPRNLYSSDLARAMQTAQIIAEETGLEIIATPKLREADFGQWEGKTYAEVQADSPAAFDNWVQSDFHNAPPGGESAAELRERVIAFLAEVIEKHPGRTSALVTHGGPCKYAIAHTLGISPGGIYRYAVDNASVHIIEIGPYGWRLATLNDTCHLRAATTTQTTAG
jgi:probable phosphoglycerate mutase